MRDLFDMHVVRISDVAEAESAMMGWLTPAELDRYEAMRVPKRRRDWLAGRVAAKVCCGARHGLIGDDAMREIEIVAIADGVESGRPTYRVRDAEGRHCLSITHSGDTAAAALALRAGARLGIDIEQVEGRDASFEELVLAPLEIAALRALTGHARALAVTRVFAMKEAVTKALGCGLRMDLRDITVALEGGDLAAGDPPFHVARPAHIASYERARAGTDVVDDAVLAWTVLD